MAVIIVLLIALYGTSWIATCGVIKLITMCLGLQFNWAIATGIWFIILVLVDIYVMVKKD